MTADRIKTTVKKNAWGEYQVRLHIDGVYQKNADYFTDDRKDADDTARCMRENAVRYVKDNLMGNN